MIQRLALLCLSFLLIASATASAAQARCPAADARQMAHVMAADCDMVMGDMGHGEREMMAPSPSGAPDMPMDETACCCPAIVAALPSPPLPDGLAPSYPPLFDTPLDASPVSVASVPEPPPPRA